MAVRLSSTFVFRKLHQLTGIIPLGLFLLEHFYTNSKAMTGPADFNNAVRDLQSIPYIIFIEVLGIFVPLIYHAVYFLFITFHVLNFRFGLIPGLNEISVAEHPDRAFGIVSGEFGNVWIFVVYVVGITATVWHLANGIWLFAVDWGVVIGERAQRLTGYACIAIGLLLLAVGINAQVAFLKQ